MRIRIPAWTAIAILLPLSQAGAQTADLVRDLYPGTAGADFGVGNLTAAGDRAFFLGSFGATQAGVWTTDGTAAGTQPLLEVCVPIESEQCGAFYPVGTLGSLHFFLAGLSGSPTLVRSDGTRAGTIALDPSGLPPFIDQGSLSPARFAVLGQALCYLPGSMITGSRGLWRSDGTVAGTVQIAAAGSGALVPLGGKLYFLDRAAAGGTVGALWRTDCTAAGTVKVADVSAPALLGAAGQRVYLVAGAGTAAGAQLWVTDGSAAPKALTHFTAGAAGAAGANWLQAVGEQVYFLADDGTHGQQLWVSDGTAAGTLPVTSFAGPLSFPDTEDSPPTAGGRLVFFAGNAQEPASLWASGGTPASTAPLCAGRCTGSLALLASLGSRVVASIEGTVWGTDGTAAGTVEVQECAACGPFIPLRPEGAIAYFAGQGTATGQVIWQTDGTASGTRRFGAPATAGIAADTSLQVAPLGKRLLFTDPAPRHDLSVSDGTAAGTTLLGDAWSAASSMPADLTAAGSLLYFTAFVPGAQGGRLAFFQSGGTAATTVPVAGLPSPGQPLAALGGTLFYLFDSQVWRIDGTASGTRQLVDLGAGASVVGQAIYQSALYLVVQPSGAAGVSLWKSDGTVAGTRRLFNLPPAASPTADARFSGLWAVGGLLFYTFFDGEELHLWRSDGTAGGTFEIAAAVAADPLVTVAGGRIYFSGSLVPGGVALWQTDGTVAGTSPVMATSPPAPSAQPDFPQALTAVGDVLLFFQLTSPVPGAGPVATLWRSDGTAAGTVPLATFQPAPTAVSITFPRTLGVLGGQAVFAIDDGVHGLEPWVTDGTSGGTRLLADLNPGGLDSAPANFTAAAGRIYFAATDGLHGRELWQTDGTTAGTRLVQDIDPGPADSGPAQLTQVGNLLYFTADDGLAGDELWALPLSGPTCQPGPTTQCLLGSRFKVAAAWLDPQGNTGAGQAAALTPDTGTFWFFSADNVEVVDKAIDGRALGGDFWFFYGALSNVEYWLTVTDTTTGAARRYHNLPGEQASVGDTAAFGTQGDAAHAAAAAAGPSPSPSPRPAAGAGAAATGDTTPCAAAPATLCLDGGRFAVSVAWQDFSGNRGVGTAVDLSDDTGTFWFFTAANVELVLKILDGRTVNGHFWVFYGALSNVAYTITVRDTTTGTVRTYTNPAGQFASVADTNAF